MSQPVHKLRMSGWLSPDSEVLGCAYEPMTEEVSPRLVDDYSRSDRVRRVNQPTGKVEPVSGFLLVSRFERMEQAEAILSNFMQGLLEFPSAKTCVLRGFPLR